MSEIEEGREVWIRAKAYRSNDKQSLVEVDDCFDGTRFTNYTLNVLNEQIRTDPPEPVYDKHTPASVTELRRRIEFWHHMLDALPEKWGSILYQLRQMLAELEKMPGIIDELDSKSNWMAKRCVELSQDPTFIRMAREEEHLQECLKKAYNIIKKTKERYYSDSHTVKESLDYWRGINQFLSENKEWGDG